MRATARAQPNIALIKYWGKSDVSRNLPAVGSISITLDTLYTTMSVEFDSSIDEDYLTVNGAVDPEMLPRVSRCLDAVCGKDRARATVASQCNFPIAAGLASSSSAFAALVVAAEFEGMRPIARHQLVYKCLGSLVGNEIHALSIKALTPDEWQQAGGR